MTDRQQQAARLAHGALRRSLVADPDDFDHPVHETLEALVDGVLSPADREAVASHVAECDVCAEDVADLEQIRATLSSGQPPAPPRQRYLQTGMIAAGIAAAIVLAVWIGQRPDEQSAASSAPPERSARPTDTPTRLTADEAQLVARVIAAGELDVPADTRALAGKSGILLGTQEPAPTFGPDAPRATAVTNTRPAFAWRPHPGATTYTVAIFDDQFNEVARGARLGGTAWTPTADLPRGKTYAWQVTAHTGAGDVTAPGPPQPEARFHIVDERTAATAAEQRSRLADQPLALGILLSSAGLLQEAARELERAGEPGLRVLTAPR